MSRPTSPELEKRGEGTPYGVPSSLSEPSVRLGQNFANNGNGQHVDIGAKNNAESVEQKSTISADAHSQYAGPKPNVGPGIQRKHDHDERLLGMPKHQSRFASRAVGDRSYDYEAKYPEDEPEKEAGDDARVWKVYLDEAEIFDDDMVRGFRETIDSLLVFAALFSAVVTTFVVETSQNLQPDYAQISASVLIETVQLIRANGNTSVIDGIPVSYRSLDSSTFSSSDVWMNGLFFTSLSLSLSTALLSVLVKQWIQISILIPVVLLLVLSLFQAYSTVSSGTAKDRALVRQFRFAGLLRWKLPEIIGILPLLLHGSLAIFFIGLVLYVRSLNDSLAWVVIVVGGLAFSSYLGSVVLPAIRIDCPYQIPVLFVPSQFILLPVRYLRYFYRRSRRYRALRPQVPSLSGSLSLKMYELKTLNSGQQRDHEIGNAILWLHGVSSNATVSSIAARAVAGLQDGFPFAHNLAWSKIPDTLWAHLLDRYTDIGNSKMPEDIHMRALNKLGTYEYAVPGKVQARFVRAAEIGNVAVMKMLLQRTDLDVDALSHYSSFNALHLASTCLRTDAVKFLLENGAAVDSQTNAEADERLTALQLAAAQHHRIENQLDVVKLLLDNGADIDAHGGLSQTALQLAVANKNLTLVKLLLERGASIVISGLGYARNALTTASQGTNVDIVKVLLDRGGGAVVNAPGEQFVNALQAASYWGNLGMVKLLLEHSAEINASDNHHGTAMTSASDSGHLEVVRLLLDSGADPNIVTDRYGTALQAATRKRHLDIVKLLLERGADVNAKGGTHGSALRAAVNGKRDYGEVYRGFYDDIISVLRQHGATD